MAHAPHVVVWHKAREYAGHWMVTGVILAATGVAPEHWFSELLHAAHLPAEAMHLWAVGLDPRVLLVAAGVLMIGGDIAWRRLRPRAEPTPRVGAIAGPGAQADPLPLPDRPSIAVLAFANMSGDPDQEYFSDGVADDIITELSRDRALFVIARNSSFTYRGRSVDVKQVGRELGVRYIVEGSVRREAATVRVSAQLIDATTGSHVWAERYDRALEHVFAVQDEIAEAVATAIRPAVGDAEQRRVMRKTPGSLSVWEAYHRGVWHLSNHTAAEYQQAQLRFQQAADIDPKFASAFVGLATTYVLDAMVHGSRPFPEAARLAEAAARQAVALDPSDSEAQTALSMAFAVAGDMNAALHCADRALVLNRNSAAAHEVRAGTLTYTGRHAEGRNEALISLRINPRDPASTMAAVIVVASYYLERNYAATVEAALRCLANNPANPMPRRYLVAALGQLGRQEEAAAALREWLLVAPGLFDVVVRNRPPYVRPEDHEHMLEGLRKAGWDG